MYFNYILISLSSPSPIYNKYLYIQHFQNNACFVNLYFIQHILLFNFFFRLNINDYIFVLHTCNKNIGILNYNSFLHSCIRKSI